MITRVVLDTNVLISGLKSTRGASYQVLQMLDSGAFTPLVSPPLCFEYEDVLQRPGLLPHLTCQEIDDFLDYLLACSEEIMIYYLWRPTVHDPKDDLVLEVALAGGASHIVTHNIKDLEPALGMGISVVTPNQFLHILPST